MESQGRVNILTLKWGTQYSAEYVNCVYRGVGAHLRRPFRFSENGTPSPTQAIEGFRGSKHIDGWTLPCPWVKELWEK